MQVHTNSPGDQWSPIRGWKLAAILSGAAAILIAGIVIALLDPSWIGFHGGNCVDACSGRPAGPFQQFADIAVASIAAFVLVLWACIGRERPRTEPRRR
ncbi:MAG: hypothetical protein ACJ77A_17500 [Actinomycetota bacterium]